MKDERELRKVRAVDGRVVAVSRSVILHVFLKHRTNFLQKVGISHPEELEELVIRVLREAREVLVDQRTGGIIYVLPHDGHFICVITYENIVRTAYLLGPSSYARQRRRRWRPI